MLKKKSLLAHRQTEDFVVAVDFQLHKEALNEQQYLPIFSFKCFSNTK